MICPKCEGFGQQPEEYPIIIKYPLSNFRHKRYSNACKKCHGTGEIDWIENIVGKQGEMNIDVLMEYSFERLVG